MMKTIEEYLNQSYRMVIFEDFDEGGLSFLFQICLAVSPAAKPLKVRSIMHKMRKKNGFYLH